MDLVTISVIISIIAGLIAIYEFIRHQPWKRKTDPTETLREINTKLGRIVEYFDGLTEARPEIKDPFNEGMAHKEKYEYGKAIRLFKQALAEGATGSQRGGSTHYHRQLLL